LVNKLVPILSHILYFLFGLFYVAVGHPERGRIVGHMIEYDKWHKNLATNCVDNIRDAANRFLSCIYRSPCTIVINKEGHSPQQFTRAASRSTPSRISLIFYNFRLLLVLIKSDPEAAASSSLLSISSTIFHNL